MSKGIQLYFKHLTDLLQAEWKAEKELHFEILAKLSVKQRRDKGYSWFPLDIIDNGFAIGQKPFLILQKTKNVNVAHYFKSGGRVELSLLKSDKAERLTGTVNWVKRDKIKIIFNQEKLPDWLFKGAIIANVFFDERSFIAMQKALDDVRDAKNDSRLNYLSKVLIGDVEPYFRDEDINYFNTQLNDNQNNAVEKALLAEDYFIIHGPPGTGKTTTLVATIEQLIQKQNSILVSAASNTAVDLLVLKLAEKKLNVVRIGNLSRMNEEVYTYTLESVLENHKDAKSIKKMKLDVTALRKKARTFKRNFGFEEAQQRRQLFLEAKQLANQIKIAEAHLVATVLDRAEIIATTLVGVDNIYLKNKTFETVIIDEAAQALEPACFIAIAKAKKVIMAGDPFQLPPTIKSRSKNVGLEVTLMEKLMEKNQSVGFLNVQYRMNETIMQFSSKYFYDNTLLADQTVAFQNLSLLDNAKMPIEFIDTAGCGFEEIRNEATKSLYNPEEYNIIGIHLTKLINNVNDENYSIAIITPYKAQVKYMEEHIENHFTKEQANIININSVDAFQGQERDIVYISLVRSNSKNEIGFLKDYRRMNVAITRARKKLVIVGDSATVGNDSFYSQFIDYVQSIDSYKSAWEFMV